MGAHGSLTRYDLRVRKFDIPIAGLAPELEGFTIAHVSDLHSGIFCGPRRLAIISSATNDLKPDLVVVTGDIINDNMADLPAAMEAIKSLRSPCGTYVCEGNHDVIPGPGLVAAAFLRERIPWLSNSTTTLFVRGRRLLLGGVPWIGRFFGVDSQMVGRLYPPRQEGDVRILLAHHPHFFDSAGSADLVLTGHTHGGQIMAGPVGFGPLLFKYWSGLYRHGDTTMIVSNGAGDWFPCRIGAPAEIGLLRLTKA
jgi:predicted MPP superfamily phosphohydrolase